MPIYEYRCESCGHELDKMQKVSDPPLTDCPACGRAALKKVISPVGFRLKGSGWYETDFKKGDKKKNLHEAGERKETGAATDKGEKKGDHKGKGPGEGKSETKTKTAPKPTAAGA